MSWSLLAFATDFNLVSAQVKSSRAPSILPFSKCTNPLSILNRPSIAKSLVSGSLATSRALSIDSRLIFPSILKTSNSNTFDSAGVSLSDKNSTIPLPNTIPNSATPSQLVHPIFSSSGSRSLSPLS